MEFAGRLSRPSAAEVLDAVREDTSSRAALAQGRDDRRLPSGNRFDTVGELQDPDAGGVGAYITPSLWQMRRSMIWTTILEDVRLGSEVLAGLSSRLEAARSSLDQSRSSGSLDTDMLLSADSLLSTLLFFAAFHASPEWALPDDGRLERVLGHWKHNLTRRGRLELVLPHESFVYACLFRRIVAQDDLVRTLLLQSTLAAAGNRVAVVGPSPRTLESRLHVTSVAPYSWTYVLSSARSGAHLEVLYDTMAALLLQVPAYRQLYPTLAASAALSLLLLLREVLHAAAVPDPGFLLEALPAVAGLLSSWPAHISSMAAEVAALMEAEVVSPGFCARRRILLEHPLLLRRPSFESPLYAKGLVRIPPALHLGFAGATAEADEKQRLRSIRWAESLRRVPMFVGAWDAAAVGWARRWKSYLRHEDSSLLDEGSDNAEREPPDAGGALGLCSESIASAMQRRLILHAVCCDLEFDEDALEDMLESTGTLDLTLWCASALQIAETGLTSGDVRGGRAKSGGKHHLATMDGASLAERENEDDEEDDEQEQAAARDSMDGDEVVNRAANDGNAGSVISGEDSAKSVEETEEESPIAEAWRLHRRRVGHWYALLRTVVQSHHGPLDDDDEEELDDDGHSSGSSRASDASSTDPEVLCTHLFQPSEIPPDLESLVTGPSRWYRQLEEDSGIGGQLQVGQQFLPLPSLRLAPLPLPALVSALGHAEVFGGFLGRAGSTSASTGHPRGPGPALDEADSWEGSMWDPSMDGWSKRASAVQAIRQWVEHRAEGDAMADEVEDASGAGTGEAGVIRGREDAASVDSAAQASIERHAGSLGGSAADGGGGGKVSAQTAGSNATPPGDPRTTLPFVVLGNDAALHSAVTVLESLHQSYRRTVQHARPRLYVVPTLPGDGPSVSYVTRVFSQSRKVQRARAGSDQLPSWEEPMVENGPSVPWDSRGLGGGLGWRLQQLRQAPCSLPAFLASIDPWYRREVYAPFHGDGRALPLEMDPSAWPVSFRSDPRDSALPAPTPTQLDAELLQQYIRGADQAMSLHIFEVRLWPWSPDTDSSGTADVEPSATVLCTSLEIGVMAEVAWSQSQTSIASEAASLSQQGFIRPSGGQAGTGGGDSSHREVRSWTETATDPEFRRQEQYLTPPVHLNLQVPRPSDSGKPGHSAVSGAAVRGGAPATPWTPALRGRVCRMRFVNVPSADDLQRVSAATQSSSSGGDAGEEEDSGRGGSGGVLSLSQLEATREAAEAAANPRLRAAGLAAGLSGVGGGWQPLPRVRARTSRGGQGQTSTEIRFPWLWEKETRAGPDDPWLDMRVVPSRGATTNLLAKKQRRLTADAVLEAMDSDSVSVGVTGAKLHVDTSGVSRWNRGSRAAANKQSVAVLLDGQLVPFRVRQFRIVPHPSLPSVDVMRFM